MINDYIQESKNWFFKKYLIPSTDTVRIIVVLAGVLVSLNIAWGMLNKSTEVTIMRFPIFVENTDDSSHFIKNLFSPNKSVDQVFAQYMITRYVKLRESYTSNLLEPPIWYSRLTNISGMSSNKIFDEFLNEVLPSKNPDSPIIKYRFNTSVVPMLDSITMTQFSGSKPTAATIYFKALECDHKYNTCLSRDYKIDVEFEINTYPRFRFRIQDYRKSPINKTDS